MQRDVNLYYFLLLLLLLYYYNTSYLEYHVYRMASIDSLNSLTVGEA